jgi:hypothetical protein
MCFDKQAVYKYKVNLINTRVKFVCFTCIDRHKSGSGQSINADSSNTQGKISDERFGIVTEEFLLQDFLWGDL